MRSDLPLPTSFGDDGSDLGTVDLVEAPARRFTEAHRILERGRPRWFDHARLPDDTDYLRWTGLFEFLVSPDGASIARHALEAATLEAFQTYLLGHVLSFALLKRGIEPLHATAVGVNDGAVVFVGDCGHGKSTLGAAFVQAGAPLLTDDLLVVAETARGPSVFPGPSRIKLFPEVARRLLGERGGGTPMNPMTPKLVIPLPDAAATPRPVRAIYVLVPRPSRRAIAIRSLLGRHALLALLRNTFNTVIVERGRLARQLDAATRIAARVPIKALTVPRALERLPDVRAAVQADLDA